MKLDKPRWLNLMEQLGIESNLNTFDKLCYAYAEKHRHYHNATHIIATLKHLDAVEHLANATQEIEIALWFHDAIYQPFSKTNEADSAKWAVQFLIDNGIASGIIERVNKLIMATLHSAPVETNDEKLMVDIDLSILGTSAEVYATFENNVRKEYRWVPSLLFNKARKSILESFLAKDRLYHCDCFYDLLERQARLNLKSAISRF